MIDNKDKLVWSLFGCIKCGHKAQILANLKLCQLKCKECQSPYFKRVLILPHKVEDDCLHHFIPANSIFR